MVSGVPTLFMARRIDVAEHDPRAGRLAIRMMMLSALSPEDVRDRDVVAMRRVGQIAIQPSAHYDSGHQKSGQPHADSTVHAVREPQGTSEVKLKGRTGVMRVPRALPGALWW